MEVAVLGPLRVSVDGRPVELTSDRLRVMVAVLAMSAGRAVSVERLAEAVWGADLPNDARRTLQTYVTRLRGAMGRDAIATEPAGYALRVSPDDVDALRLTRLSDAAADGPTERAELVEALLLWRGAPFAGLDSDWLRETEAPRLSERRLSALERRVDLDLADGRFGEVAAELRELVIEHPLRESLWARLLRALAGSGRSAEALEQYERIRTRIADELGVDPGGELRRLHADLLAGTPVEPGRPDPGPAQQARVVPRQLPVDLSRFTGRADVLSRLDALVDGDPGGAGGVTVVAVHGTGGVGKTSLVLHWAHRIAHRFADGQLYLNLRGHGPGAPVGVAAALDSLLRGLGVAGDEIPADDAARSSLLRSMLAERRMLVVLDNVHEAEQVRPLLPGSGGSLVVVTSRSQLRGLVAREGAHRIAVDQLSPDESVDLLATSLAAAGVPHTAQDLVELAELCGHLPLALAIAAERAGRRPELGLVELIADLHQRSGALDVLDTGEDSTSLRAVFASSYRALDAETGRLFRLLGVHPGPDLGVPAASALVGVPRPVVRRLLDRLVDANLLQQRRYARYELHDLLRAYAAELADLHEPEPQRTAAVGRFLGWFVQSAANARVAMSPSPPLIGVPEPEHDTSPVTFDGWEHAVAWFDSERANLAPVVALAVGGGHDRMTYGLVHMVSQYLTRRRSFDQLLDLLPVAVDAARRQGDVAAEAQSSYLLGTALAERLRYTEARPHLERALGLFEQAGHRRGRLRVLTNLGVLASQQGRPAECAGYLEQVVATDDEDGSPAEQVNPLYNLAEVYRKLDRLEDAAEVSLRAVDICRTHDIPTTNEAAAFDTLAGVRSAQGRTDEAIAYYRRSVELFDECQDRWFESIALTNLGRAHASVGEVGSAREAWERALEIFDRLDAADGVGHSRSELVALLKSVPGELPHP